MIRRTTFEHENEIWVLNNFLHDGCKGHSVLGKEDRKRELILLTNNTWQLKRKKLGKAVKIEYISFWSIIIIHHNCSQQLVDTIASLL